MTNKEKLIIENVAQYTLNMANDFTIYENDSFLEIAQTLYSLLGKKVLIDEKDVAYVD